MTPDSGGCDPLPAREATVTWFAPSVVFRFFAAMMDLQLIWVVARVPETEGVPLEELQLQPAHA